MSRRKQANPKPLKNDERFELPETPSETSLKDDNIIEDYLEFDDDDDDERPLVIDTADSQLSAEEPQDDPPMPSPGGNINWQQGTNSTSWPPAKLVEKKATGENLVKSILPGQNSNSVGTLKDYLEMPAPGESRRSSLSSESSSVETPNQSKEQGTRGAAPNKTRRKGDRILPVGGSGGPKFVCPVCKSVMLDLTEFTKHIRSHNSQTNLSPNCCTICSKVLSSQSSLDRHMLVHSGERPFMCHVCKMSFTTNGNMHRHMRIHEKELGPAALTMWKESPSHKARNSRRKNSDPDIAIVEKITEKVSEKPESIMGGVKRHLEEDEQQRGSPAKRILSMSQTRDFSYVSPGSNSETEVALPISPYVKLLSIGKNSKESGEEYDRLECPLCSKSFLCSYGLDTHLDTHGAHAAHLTRCQLCGLAFHNSRQLHIHTAKVHAHTTNNTQNTDNTPVPIGFHDLEFIDFSSNKFEVVAKAWCEKFQRRSSSLEQSYTCDRCEHAFPSQSSLQLHLAAHAPERASTCMRCQVTFGTRAEYQDHAKQHCTELVVKRYSNMEGTDDNLIQDTLEKEEFLLVVGLKVKKTPSKLREIPDKTIRQNQDMTNEMIMMKKTGPLNNGLSFTDNYLTPLKSRTQPNQDMSCFQPIQRDNEGVLQMTRPVRPLALRGSPADRHDLADISQLLEMTSVGLMNRGQHNTHADDLDDSSQSEELADGCDITGAMIGQDGVENVGKGGPYVCKYCDETFHNDRFYKGHVRSHLGLSPYKCRLCPYSSADKSTLVRHLRTHNGERPFQCLVCDFAFTTKANCERHVRKKHGLESKESIETSIGYTTYVDESAQEKSDFGSPDTVCKYCGEDFKFFRALKHHLRAHSSCRYKPYMCRLCSNGFSTKANCVRHVQKQHRHVEANQVEAHIVVNEVGVGGEGEEGCMSDGGREDEECKEMERKPERELDMSLMGVLARGAENLMKPGVGWGGSNTHAAIRAHLKAKKTSYVPTHSAMSGKQEVVDQPLDFSLKANQYPEVVNVDEDTPMDLSVRRKPVNTQGLSTARNPLAFPAVNSFPSPKQNWLEAANRLPVADHSPMKLPTQLPTAYATHNKPTAAHSVSEADFKQYYNQRAAKLQCPICKMFFKHGLKLAAHMRIHNSSTSTSVPSKRFPPTDVSLPLHTQLAQAYPLPRQVKQEPVIINDQVKETNNNVPGLKSADKWRVGLEGPQSADLASLSNILTATHPTNFTSFLRASSQTKTPHVVPEPTTERVLPPLKTETTSPVPAPAAEAVTIETEGPAAKKKRNSYADSPHKLQCPYCTRAFPWISSLKRHILTHTGQKPFKCPQCPVTFSTKSNRERHMIRKHGLDVHDPATRQMMDRPYKCHLCVFSSFSTAANLVKHYSEKHPDKEIPDTVMNNASFSEQEPTTDDILAAIATIDKKYAADTAAAVGGSQAAPVEIEDDDDDDDDDFEELPSPVSRSSTPSSQHRTSTPARLNNHTPTPQITSQRTPSQHTPTPQHTPERSHINPERDNYNVDKITSCWKCDVDFPDRKTLLRHLKEHNVDLPYKCYLCDASFNLRLDSLQHKVTVHPTDWTMVKQKNNIIDINQFSEKLDQVVEGITGGDQGVTGGENFHPDADYTQRKVYCSFCAKRFWSLQDLRRHMRSHTGERPFECDVCQARFTLKHSMMRHRRKHEDTAGASTDSEEEQGAGTDTDAVTTEKVLSFDSTLQASPKPTQTTPFASYSSKPKMQAKPRLAETAVTEPEDDQSADILHNLLGVDDSAIDQMLYRPALEAAKQLGMN